MLFERPNGGSVNKKYYPWGLASTGIRDKKKDNEGSFLLALVE